MNTIDFLYFLSPLGLVAAFAIIMGGDRITAGIVAWWRRPPPCPHEYETITTLKDRPRNPQAATIVQACRLCGETREQTFRTPKVEDGNCRHKWKFVADIPVYDTKRYDDNGRKTDGLLPVHRKRIHSCEHCGEEKITTT